MGIVNGGRPIAIRFNEATMARFDAIASYLSERAHGAPIARTRVIEMIIDRGLPLLEAELGIGAKPKAPRKRQT
jgi:hypothetical protein